MTAPSHGAGSAEDVERLTDEDRASIETALASYTATYDRTVVFRRVERILAAHVARAPTADRERVARAVIGALKPYGFGAAAIADRLRAALAAPHVEPVDG